MKTVVSGWKTGGSFIILSVMVSGVLMTESDTSKLRVIDLEHSIISGLIVNVRPDTVMKLGNAVVGSTDKLWPSGSLISRV